MNAPANSLDVINFFFYKNTSYESKRGLYLSTEKVVVYLYKRDLPILSWKKAMDSIFTEGELNISEYMQEQAEFETPFFEKGDKIIDAKMTEYFDRMKRSDFLEMTEIKDLGQTTEAEAPEMIKRLQNEGYNLLPEKKYVYIQKKNIDKKFSFFELLENADNEKTIIVHEWFLKKNVLFYDSCSLKGKIIKETEKAMLVNTDKYDGWLPKKAIKEVQ